MRKILKNKLIYIIGSIVILLILLITIKFPYDIKVPCQIMAQKEWALIQIETDKLLSKIYDNTEDRILNFTLLQFAREDFVQFKQYSAEENWINKNDPIANITSLDNQISLSNLTGELEKARDNLAIVSAGEKQALLEEAKRALELANIQFDAYEPQYLRNKELFEKKLISSAEWEITRATYDGFKSNISLQKARLDVMQTGEKNEIIRYTQDHIAQLRSQVQLMNKKMALGDIRAPFDGLISYPTQDSIICLLENVDSLLCKLPVSAAELKYLETGQEISIRLFETGREHKAELLVIGHRSKFINGSPSYVVTGYLSSETDEINPGMSGIATVHCDNITLLEHLIRSFNIYAIQI
jgi:hypothetical protein